VRHATDATAAIDDITIVFRAVGQGPPVVRGMAQDRRSWSAQQEALCDVRTYAYDLRGHGETSLGEADGTLAQLGLDLIGFLENVVRDTSCSRRSRERWRGYCARSSVSAGALGQLDGRDVRRGGRSGCFVARGPRRVGSSV
jgi:hypothetical protein